MRINRPPDRYCGHLHLRYKGKNYNFFQAQKLSKAVIIEIDYNLKEELVVSLTTFDGTEIKFSMISSNLYMKVNGKYELQETQNFCSFQLLLTDKLMLFEGFISYHKNFEGPFSFIEDFAATITVNENPSLLQTWINREQIIIAN